MAMLFQHLWMLLKTLVSDLLDALVFEYRNFGRSLKSATYAKDFDPDEKGIAQQIHEVTKTLVEDYFVPGHDPRANSDVFNATHRKLIVTEDKPCYICGVSKSTLKDSSKNLCGSSQMELHHWVIEWSLANATDFVKLKTEHPEFPDWDKVNPNDPSTFKYFIDSEYNGLVLCDIHHRAKYRGIHAVEYPVWLAQKFIKPDFKYIDTSNMKDALEFVDDMSDHDLSQLDS